MDLCSSPKCFRNKMIWCPRSEWGKCRGSLWVNLFYSTPGYLLTITVTNHYFFSGILRRLLQILCMASSVVLSQINSALFKAFCHAQWGHTHVHVCTGIDEIVKMFIFYYFIIKNTLASHFLDKICGWYHQCKESLLKLIQLFWMDKGLCSKNHLNYLHVHALGLWNVKQKLYWDLMMVCFY